MIIISGKQDYYLVENGHRRLIPDMSTMEQMGFTKVGGGGWWWCVVCAVCCVLCDVCCVWYEMLRALCVGLM